MLARLPARWLQLVQAGMVRRIAKLYAEQGQGVRMATIDQDATIIESHKQAALAHSEGGRGYQPMVALWAEIVFVPGEAAEKKDSRPLRYVGLRLLKTQGTLFADGSDRHHHAVVTNLDWEGSKLLDWHREKAGTIEHVHDEVKNGLGGGHMPSQHFAVNAAWFKMALMTYNLASAIKGLCFSPEERTARCKKYRLLLVHLAGRMSRFQCKLRLRFCASVEAIKRVQRVWEVFALPTQATAFR